MNKRIKGFSLVELMISLLIISIVLSATIPAITSKTKSEAWSWTTDNSAVFTATGSSQRVYIGSNNTSIDKGKLVIAQDAPSNCSNPQIVFYSANGNTALGGIYVSSNRLYFCTGTNVTNGQVGTAVKLNGES